jgi:hypothetical protein
MGKANISAGTHAREQGGNDKTMMLDGKLFEAAQEVANELLKRAGRFRDGKMLLVVYGMYEGGYTDSWYLTELDGTIRLTNYGDKTDEPIPAIDDLFRFSVEDGRDEYRDIRLFIDKGTISVDVVWQSDMPEPNPIFLDRDYDWTPEESARRKRARSVGYSELYFGNARLVWHTTPRNGWDADRGDIRTDEDLPYPEGEPIDSF